MAALVGGRPACKLLYAHQQAVYSWLIHKLLFTVATRLLVSVLPHLFIVLTKAESSKGVRLLWPRGQAQRLPLSSATSSGYISGWESLVKCHCVLTTHSWHTGVRWWCVLLHSTFLFSFQNVNLLKIGFLKKVLFVLTNESALGQLQCKIMVLI